MARLARLARIIAPLSLLVACSDDPAGSGQSPGADGGSPPLPSGFDAGTFNPGGGALPPLVLPGSDAGPSGGGSGSGPGVDADVPNVPAPDAATGPSGTDTSCCSGGDCLCHGPQPTALTGEPGPYETESYTIPGVGCVVYPTNAEGKLAAVTVSDGYGGSGGCGFSQTGNWGPFYASWGIVTMIVSTNGGDSPPVRGEKLGGGIEAFKEANEDPDSPLFGKLAGRYGTSGFSMGGGGTSYASRDDATLKSSVAIMPWSPVTSNVEVPTLVICGSSDTIASCNSHGNRLYGGIADSVPKMRVEVTSGHNGQPSAGMGRSGAYGLAFQKVFLEGDERWRPLLVAAESEETNIR